MPAFWNLCKSWNIPYNRLRQVMEQSHFHTFRSVHLRIILKKLVSILQKDWEVEFTGASKAKMATRWLWAATLSGCAIVLSHPVRGKCLSFSISWRNGSGVLSMMWIWGYCWGSSMVVVECPDIYLWKDASPASWCGLHRTKSRKFKDIPVMVCTFLPSL